jgi:sensor histidine kinase regulating citrate/malate metabolism
MASIALNPLEKFKPKKLLDSVTLIVMLLVVVLLVSIGLIFSQLTYDILLKQTQKRAIQTARQLTMLPELYRFLQSGTDFAAIDRLIDEIRKESEAEYIMIADRNGTILSHPDQNKEGTRIASPLTLRALNFGRSYTEQTSENNSRFIRGTVPVMDDAFRIIGLVSSGYPLAGIREVSESYLEKIIFSIFVFITLGLIAANLIARGVKWIIFGLEPAEIAYLFQERNALIESMREGMISTDATGMIKLVNEAAVQTLNLTSKSDLLDRNLTDFFPPLDFSPIINSGESLHDKEFFIKGIPIIVNIEPVGEQSGLVMTFRNKEEIDIIAQELSQVKSYSEMLRAQTHEYSNSLHTIVGMIQMGADQDVLDYIAEETEGHRKLIRFLAENLPDRILSSLIIGKQMYASELKVLFRIDSESRMTDIPDGLDRLTLSTALGNVIDNAIEAASQGGRNSFVQISMSDFGNDLIFEVEDSGSGINISDPEVVFTKGYSSKDGEKRGYGLYLAKQSIETLGGTIWYENITEGGTRFEIIIPKVARSL